MCNSDSDTKPVKDRMKRYKFISEESYGEFKGCSILNYVNINKLKDNKLKVKNLKDNLKLRDDRRSSWKKFEEINFNLLDDFELITFNPKKKQYKKVVEILNLDPKSKIRKRVVERLETEFCRLYSRYRKAVERESGKTSRYILIDSERKYANKAALLCISKSVTPRQVIEYWHKNIQSFKTSSPMSIPPLVFLSSPANIDTVACSVFNKNNTLKRRKIKREAKPESGNSFTDVSNLNTELRSFLSRAGFDVQKYSDEFLLTVQKNALSLAMKKDIFIPKSEIGDMSRWVAKNLYSKKNRMKGRYM